MLQPGLLIRRHSGGFVGRNKGGIQLRITLQNGLRRHARLLNAGLSAELDVTWPIVFLQRFLCHFLLVLLHLKVVFPCWNGDRQQNSSVGFVNMRFSLSCVLAPCPTSGRAVMLHFVILIAMLVGISQYQCVEINTLDLCLDIVLMNVFKLLLTFLWCVSVVLCIQFMLDWMWPSVCSLLVKKKEAAAVNNKRLSLSINAKCR